jgi:hypothetical protein
MFATNSPLNTGVPETQLEIKERCSEQPHKPPHRRTADSTHPKDHPKNARQAKVDLALSGDTTEASEPADKVILSKRLPSPQAYLQPASNPSGENCQHSHNCRSPSGDSTRELALLFACRSPSGDSIAPSALNSVIRRTPP